MLSISDMMYTLNVTNDIELCRGKRFQEGKARKVACLQMGDGVSSSASISATVWRQWRGKTGLLPQDAQQSGQEKVCIVTIII